MAASVYTTLISKIDEYGFERPKGFDYVSYDKFMTAYLAVLVRRAKRWESLIGTKPLTHKSLKRSTKLQRFVRKGIPMKYRADVWMIISGASKKRDENPNLYSELCTKRVAPTSVIIEQINTDIPRTFPTNIYFRTKSGQKQSLEQPLFNILLAFANSNSRIGYCQGLNYVAGLLLLVTKDEEKSFWILKTLVEDILPDYYSPDLPGLLTDMKVLSQLVSDHCPQVQKQMDKFEVPWELICSKWFICIFCDILPVETVFRLWDCILYDGSTLIMKAALSLIKSHEDRILTAKEFVDLVMAFKGLIMTPSTLYCHEFIEELYSKEARPVPDAIIEELRSSCGKEVEETLQERKNNA